MGTLQLLPDNVLQKQICQECFQYLSVPPVMVNSMGETICGRCFNDPFKSNLVIEKYTRSTYNLVAERFLFKCTNHLNGCTKVLCLADTKEHEKNCNYKEQECFFCSFLGNLSQILNHSLKFHPENVSFDGIFSFWLKNSAFKKKFILYMYNNIFHVTVDISKHLFTTVISPASNDFPSKINQYGVKFFKLDDPLNFDFIHTDYELLNVNLVNYYEKDIGELVTFFGPGIQVFCQILLEQLSLDDKEVELQRRFAKLRQTESEVNNYKKEVEVQERKVSQQNNLYNSAMNIIKKMSYNLFKCCSCQKLTLKDTYYCLKMHCCCEQCLTNVCKACNTIGEFKKLEDVDNFIVSCDWRCCDRQIRLEDYWDHKTVCSKRPYKCPLQDCHEALLSYENLIEHWHSEFPTLTCDETLVIEKYGDQEYYWLIHNDLYHVLVSFTQQIINVLIVEVNVVLNNISFDCTSFNNHHSGKVSSVMFCGKYHVNTNNKVVMTGGYTLSATKIEISPK